MRALQSVALAGTFIYPAGSQEGPPCQCSAPSSGCSGAGRSCSRRQRGRTAGTVTYKASKADFANPERGFYIADGYDPDQGWTDPLDLDRLRDARAAPGDECQREVSMAR